MLFNNKFQNHNEILGSGNFQLKYDQPVKLVYANEGAIQIYIYIYIIFIDLAIEKL